MKIDIKNIREKLKPENICRGFLCILEKKNKWLLFSLFLIMILSCMFLWYRYVENPGWSEERKTEYRKSKEKENLFKKTDFDEMFLEKEERAVHFHENFGNRADIFRIE